MIYLSLGFPTVLNKCWCNKQNNNQDKEQPAQEDKTGNMQQQNLSSEE